MSGFSIRHFNEADWPQVWTLLAEVFRDGTTYPYPASTDEPGARAIWLENKTAIYVASDEDTGEVIGTYYIKPNQPGRGSHVCNCGYITSPKARGRGVASAMCEHSQKAAIEFGFKAMQFNLVVETNNGAIRLWEKLGFMTIGTLPGVFDHPELGYVGAKIMFKTLALSNASIDNDT